MKQLTLLLLLIMAYPMSSLAQTVITYGYDAAGNRIIRTSSPELATISKSSTSSHSNIYPNLHNELLTKESCRMRKKWVLFSSTTQAYTRREHKTKPRQVC